MNKGVLSPTSFVNSFINRSPASEESHLDVQDLIELHPEWIVDVQHSRWFKKGDDWMLLTKGDAWRVSKTLHYSIDPFQPDTFGGLCSIKIYTPKRVYKATAICSDNDVYNKKTGREIAIRKLVSQGLEV
jgi:hypothetical protein